MVLGGLSATLPLSDHGRVVRYASKSYKEGIQETFFPVGSMPTLFCLDIQPNRLNVRS